MISTIWTFLLRDISSSLPSLAYPSATPTLFQGPAIQFDQPRKPRHAIVYLKFVFILSLPTRIYKAQLPRNLKPILHLTYVYISTSHNIHIT
jgi:hypothetical protein